MPVTRRSIRSLSCSALGAPPWEKPALPPRAALPPTSDIVVVGGGLTGLASALALAAKQQEVVVLEQAFGAGATARSGGIVLGETLTGPSPQFDGCEQSLREWIAMSGIDCDLAWEGCLELARDSSLPSEPIDWHDGGAVRCRTMVNGGVLDPAKLAAGLAAAATRAGARIVNRSSVESIEGTPSGVRLTTNRGAILARQAVMATDAMLAPGENDPWDERGITVAIQTMPLDDGARASLGLGPNQAFYTADLPLLWGRAMRDGSLLVGREMLAPALGAPSQGVSRLLSAAGVRLLARARGLHASVARVDLKRAWGGPVARTAAGFPIVARDPEIAHVTWAGGYGGHGIAQAFHVGHLVAEQLLMARRG
jgi:gamma-glutamylputrescine oxidase